MPFSEAVTARLKAAASSSGIELVIRDDRYDADTAVKNAKEFVPEGVDLITEFQIEEVAPAIAHLIARVRSLLPDIPPILTSGWTAAVCARQARVFLAISSRGIRAPSAFLLRQRPTPARWARCKSPCRASAKKSGHRRPGLHSRSDGRDEEPFQSDHWVDLSPGADLRPTADSAWGRDPPRPRRSSL